MRLAEDKLSKKNDVIEMKQISGKREFDHNKGDFSDDD